MSRRGPRPPSEVPDTPLRRLRVQQGLTTVQIAARIGIEQSMYSALELGVRKLTYRDGKLTPTARKICAYFGASAWALWGWRPPEPKPVAEVSEAELTELLGGASSPEDLVIAKDLAEKLVLELRPHALRTVIEYAQGAPYEEIGAEEDPPVTYQGVRARLLYARRNMINRYWRLYEEVER